MTSIETERLRGAPLNRGDFDDVCRMHSDPRVMATLGGLRTDDTTAGMIDRIEKLWRDHGHGLWFLRDKATGAFAGRGGFAHTNIGGAEEVELGYTFMPEYWGRGLATEFATEAVRLAFEVFGLDDIVCFTLTTNAASLRVMEKAGFQFERRLIHEGMPHIFCRQRRPAAAT